MAIECVHDLESLAEFVGSLRNSIAANPAAWENVTLDSYLAALASWIQDMDGYFLNRNQPVPAEPSWRALADILIAASIYE